MKGREFTVKIRVISLLLAIVLIVSLLPAPVSAATLEDHLAIQDQIRRIRNMAVAYTGWTSFQGYCATWVTWQTYLLGIDTTRRKLDGNQLYDYYCQLDYTSGGYKVTPFSAHYYTLEQVLMILTENGTKDAYNIMIGIERTPSADGQRYGHGVFIHAIVDGMVHFTESSATFIAGIYWPEGYPIMCTLEEFIAGYKSWVTLDGVIHFGRKSYLDQCTAYPANSYAMAKEKLAMYTQPCVPQVDPGSTLVDTLAEGEILKISGLYATAEGEYWYQVKHDGATGYVKADAMHVIALCYDDVKEQNVSGFSVLHQGSGYTLYGDVLSSENLLSMVEVSVCAVDSDAEVLSVQIPVDTRSFSLSSQQVKDALAVHTLPMGEYTLQIRATVTNHTVENGERTEHMQMLTLWDSRFAVIDDWSQYPLINFDACGGDTVLDQAAVEPGAAVGKLPEAFRPGYRFEGWFTDPDGGERITANQKVQTDATYYAHWNEDPSGLDGWAQTEKGWTYYRQGKLHSGWLDYEGLRFYTYPDGKKASGWRYINQRLYYFGEGGAITTGWVEINSVPHFIQQDGTGAEGWTIVDGETYYFREYGEVRAGWLTEGTNHYYLDKNGQAMTSWHQMEDKVYLFGTDGKLLWEKADDGVYTAFDRDSAEDLLEQGLCVQLG